MGQETEAGRIAFTEKYASVIAEIFEMKEKGIDLSGKDAIIDFVLKYAHSCIGTNTAGGEVR